MNRTKAFFNNSLARAILEVFVLISGMIVPRLMLVYYGSEINGLTSSISQFVSYFRLIEAGLSGAAVYALYKPLAEKNEDAINGIVSAAKKHYNKTGGLFLLAVIVLSCIYPIFVQAESVSRLEMTFLVFVLGMAGVIEFFSLSRYSVLLTADQKNYVLSIASMISIVINVAIIACLSVFRVNIVILRAVVLASVFSRSIILRLYVKLKYPSIKYNAVPLYDALSKKNDAFFQQIFYTIFRTSPIIIATVLFSLSDVSIYSVYNMVIAGIGGILGIFTTGLAASFGQVIAKNEMNTMKKTYSIFEFSYNNILTFFFSVTGVLLMPFILIYTRDITDANYNAPLFGLLIVLNAMCQSICVPLGTMSVAAGKFKEMKRRTFVRAILALLLGGTFGFFFGLSGMMIGLMIANFYGYIDQAIIVYRKVLRFNLKTSIFRFVFVFVLATIIYLPFYFLNMQINTVVQWLVYAGAVSVFAFIVIIIGNLIFQRKVLFETLIRIKSLSN